MRPDKVKIIYPENDAYKPVQTRVHGFFWLWYSSALLFDGRTYPLEKGRTSNLRIHENGAILSCRSKDGAFNFFQKQENQPYYFFKLAKNITEPETFTEPQLATPEQQACIEKEVAAAFELRAKIKQIEVLDQAAQEFIGEQSYRDIIKPEFSAGKEFKRDLISNIPAELLTEEAQCRYRDKTVEESIFAATYDNVLSVHEREHRMTVEFENFSSKEIVSFVSCHLNPDMVSVSYSWQENNAKGMVQNYYELNGQDMVRASMKIQYNQSGIKALARQLVGTEECIVTDPVEKQAILNEFENAKQVVKIYQDMEAYKQTLSSFDVLVNA